MKISSMGNKITRGRKELVRGREGRKGLQLVRGRERREEGVGERERREEAGEREREKGGRSW